MVYKAVVQLNQENIKHMRKIYSLIDLLGDLGGITEVVMLGFGFFLYSVSQHSFYLKAAKRLFLARTKNEKVFKRFQKRQSLVKKEQKIQESLPDNIKSEIKLHKPIRLKLRDSIRLFFQNTLGCFSPFSLCWKNKDKMMKLYSRSRERIDSELNIVKILSSLRDIKILMKHSLMSPQIKHMIKNSDKYLISIDDSTSIDQDSFHSEASVADEIQFEPPYGPKKDLN